MKQGVGKIRAALSPIRWDCLEKVLLATGNTIRDA